MKNKLIVFAALFIAAAVFAQSAGDFSYNVFDDDGTVYIRRYTGTASRVTIPARIDGKPVTGIYTAAFADNKTLTSVVIPEGVTFINANRVVGVGAFMDCTNLTSVTLPSSLVEIGFGAFSYCDSLSAITIPPKVEWIGTFAFSNCSSLKTIALPASIKKIDHSAFSNCTSLTTVTIPASVTELSIGLEAFEGCPLNAASIALLKKYGYDHK